jgi:hypothetical protein
LKSAKDQVLFFAVARHFAFNKKDVLTDFGVVLLKLKFIRRLLFVLGRVVGETGSGRRHETYFFTHELTPKKSV